MSILLLAAIGAKLIGPHGGLQVDKQKVCQVTGSVESPIWRLLAAIGAKLVGSHVASMSVSVASSAHRLAALTNSRLFLDSAH